MKPLTPAEMRTLREKEFEDLSAEEIVFLLAYDFLQLQSHLLGSFAPEYRWRMIETRAKETDILSRNHE